MYKGTQFIWSSKELKKPGRINRVAVLNGVGSNFVTGLNLVTQFSTTGYSVFK